ncbi:MAG: phosphoadenosine phosphosulfate reductase family protein, partial [Methylococcaceae bacterium]
MNDKSEIVRHVLGISGGKDSAALAIYMRDKILDMEYFFTDTGAELPEVYDFLDKLEAYLGKPIKRLMPNGDFDHQLKMQNGFLPSPNTRWCTREMKIRPFEEWVGEDQVITYIAIRADENREGYRSTKLNIRPCFPFKEDGL